MVEYYGNNDYRDYLMHYGVKGMKWGKHLKAKAYELKGRAGSAIDDYKIAKERKKLATENNRQANLRGARKQILYSHAVGDAKKREDASVTWLKGHGYIKKKLGTKDKYATTKKARLQDEAERNAIKKHETRKFDLEYERTNDAIERAQDSQWEDIKKRYANGTVSKEYLESYAYNSPKYKYAKEADRIVAATNNNKKAQQDGERRTRKEKEKSWREYEKRTGMKHPNEVLSRQDSNFASVTTKTAESKKKRRR